MKSKKNKTRLTNTNKLSYHDIQEEERWHRIKERLASL